MTDLEKIQKFIFDETLKCHGQLDALSIGERQDGRGDFYDGKLELLLHLKLMIERINK